MVLLARGAAPHADPKMEDMSPSHPQHVSVDIIWLPASPLWKKIS